MDSDSLLGKVFFNKYKTTQNLGEGSFGSIYLGENINTGEQFALKFENRKKGHNLLELEAMVMSYLKGCGIPNVKSYGYSGDYNIFVMELMGKSLEDTVQKNIGKKFSLKTVCMIGYQLLTILENVHDKHIIHRDIKPDNIVLGLGESQDKVFMLDFGLSRKYRSSRTLEHYPMRDRKKLTGTARYASINALKGMEQSRRDDLESVAYLLAYFLRGSLPWQGLQVKNKDDRYKKILQKKQETSVGELFEGFPAELAQFADYTKNLQFEEKPDYSKLKQLLMDVIEKHQFEFDFHYDWSDPKRHPEAKPNKMKKDIVLNHNREITQTLEAHKNHQETNYNVQMTQNKLELNRENQTYIDTQHNKHKSTIANKPTHAITIDGNKSMRKSRKEPRCCIL